MTHANMRRNAKILAALLALCGSAAYADPSDPAPQAQSDPSPKDSHNFAPSESTAGTADPGHELAAIRPISSQGCNAADPCAVPPPALPQVIPPRVSREPG